MQHLYSDHSTVESLRLGFGISPDITIERVKMRPDLDSVLPLTYQREYDSEDEDEDDCVIPLSFCVTTMDEGADEEPDVTLMVPSKSKKVARTARQSNENSSLVCNGVESKPGGKAKKRYQCQDCRKTFGWSTDLKRHTLIHTGERPFRCNICGDTFTRNFLLQKHVKKHASSVPNEAQLNNNVAKNLIEIRMRMKALEEAKGSTTPPQEASQTENSNVA